MTTPSTTKTYQEVGQQVTERLAPAKLSSFRRNAEDIAVLLHRNKLNGLSVDDWMVAISALKESLLWDIEPIPPVEPTQAEKAAKAATKAFRDALKNKPGRRDVVEVQKNNAADAAEAKKAADAKELASLKSQITHEIEGHIVGHHSGGINYTRTDSERGTLRGVLAQHKCDTVEAAKRALSAVRIAKNKLGC